MNATFVQVDARELERIQANPELAETLFSDAPLMPPAFAAAAKVLRERVKAAGPNVLTDSMKRLDPSIQRQLAERMGLAPSALATSSGAEALFKMMEERSARLEGVASAATREHEKLSLDKAWHGVHYLLCGETEPGAALLSQPVMGGTSLGDDDEGFSGYGPARYFTAAEVSDLSAALSRTELEAQAAARFDAPRMMALQIYPGWRASDEEWVMDALRRLRHFYADAATKGHAIVTCIV